jgi:protocatechuate 3,4-dioxygenase beta subunit
LGFSIIISVIDLENCKEETIMKTKCRLTLLILCLSLTMTAMVYSSEDKSPRPPLTKREDSTGENGVISGKVVDAETGEPLANVIVMLYRWEDSISQRTQTDANGEYEFVGLGSGSYNVTAMHMGYLKQTYGEEGGGISSSISLLPNAQKEHIDFRLLPAASIAGKVTDEASIPVPGCPIACWRVTQSDGNVSYEYTGIARPTNAEGEFVIADLPPGKYIVCNQHQAAADGILLNSLYPIVYYPQNSPRENAKIIEVKPKSKISGIDLVLKKPNGYTVTGTIRETTPWPPFLRGKENGAPIADAAVIISLRDMLPGNLVTISKSDGSYKFDGLSSGQYQLTADAVEQNYVRTSEWLELGVEIPTKQVDISLEKASRISGRVVTDDGSPLPTVPDYMRGFMHPFGGIVIPARSDSAQHPEASIRLFSTPDLKQTYLAPGIQPAMLNVDIDYSFSAYGVAPGENRLSFHIRPPYYIKEIRWKGQDISEKFTVQPSEELSDIEVTVAIASGTIYGQVVSSKTSAPVANVRIYPESVKEERSLRFGVSDEEGNFIIKSVPPGEYKVYAVKMGGDREAFRTRYEREKEHAVQLTIEHKEQKHIKLIVHEEE